MEAVGLTSFPGAAATASDMHDLFKQVVLSPTSLTFGSQQVGTTSASQAITLTNNQSSAVTSLSVSTSGDFGQTNNCGSSLAANSSCTINVTFTSDDVGHANRHLDRDGQRRHSNRQPDGHWRRVGNVTLTPSSVSFGNQGVGTSEFGAAVDVVEWRDIGGDGNQRGDHGSERWGFRADQQLRDDAGGKLELHDQRDVHAVGLRRTNGDGDGDRQRGHAEQQPDGNGYGHHSADHADHGAREQCDGVRQR